MPLVTGMPVGFCLPFAFWLGCPTLHYAMRIGCVVPAAFGKMEQGKEMELCSFLKLGYHFCLWPKSVAANMLLTFLPVNGWASSLYLHIVFPKVGLVQSCSLGSDPGIQRAVAVELTAFFSPHPVEQAQRQCSLC